MFTQEKIYHIDTGYACFGIITQRYNNKIIASAPIAKWSIGKDIGSVLRYYKSAKIVIGYIRYIKE